MSAPAASTTRARRRVVRGHHHEGRRVAVPQLLLACGDIGRAHRTNACGGRTRGHVDPPPSRAHTAPGSAVRISRRSGRGLPASPVRAYIRSAPPLRLLDQLRPPSLVAPGRARLRVVPAVALRTRSAPPLRLRDQLRPCARRAYAAGVSERVCENSAMPDEELRWSAGSTSRPSAGTAPGRRLASWTRPSCGACRAAPSTRTSSRATTRTPPTPERP